MAAESALAATTDRTINFKFDRLTKWGDRVLVARLKPADRGSRDVFEGIAEKRKALSAEFREAFGIGAGEKYNPHVSLGYFANRELAELSTCRLGEWTGSVRARAGDLVIGFSSISLYGFTDPRARGGVGGPAPARRFGRRARQARVTYFSPRPYF